jgi:WD40 repeat protein
MSIRSQDSAELAEAAAPEPFLLPLPKPRFRHEVLLQTATVSQDGRILVALDLEGVVLGWECATARRLYRRPLLEKGFPPQSVTCSPDGRYAAFSSRELPASVVHLIDLATGRELRILDRCFSPAFSPSGDVIAGSDGRLLRRWSIKSGAELPELEPGPRDLKWSAYSPKGNLIAASTQYSDAVLLWDVATRKRVHPGLTSPGGEEAASLAFSPDGETLAIGSHWGIEFQHLGTGPARPFHSHEEYAVGPLKFSEDGRWMTAVARRRRLLAWDLVSGRRLFTWAAYRTPDGSLAISERGDVVLWIERGGIRLERIPRRLAGPKEDHVAEDVRFTTDGKVVTVDDRGGIRLWDPRSQKELRRDSMDLRPLRALSGDGKWAIFGGGSEPLGIWDLSRNQEVFRAKIDPPSTAVGVSPDGKTLALGHPDGSLALWDLAKGEERARVRGHLESISALAWSLDGKLVAWGDESGSVAIAEGTRGADPIIFSPRKRRAIRHLTFDRDGTSVLARDDHGVFRSYPLELGRDPVTVRGVAQADPRIDRWSASGFLEGRRYIDRRALAYSADGSFAAMVTDSGELMIWEAPGGR